MRDLLLVAAMLCSVSASAAELDPAFEVGAHAGVFVFDGLDVPNTSYIVVPRFGVWFTPSLGLELDIGISTGSTEVTDHGYLALSPQLNLIGNPIPDEVNAPVRPIVTVGAGLMQKMIDGNGVRGADYAHSRSEALISVGTGLIIPIVGPLQARTDVRMLTTVAREDERYVSPFIDFSWTAGLQAVIGLAKDVDKDKIPDKRDACVNDPEDFDSFEDEDGCPEADNDGDGIPDTTDTCPNEAEDVDEYNDTDGCPDPDNDEDGILDGDDTCPMKPGPAATYGCPDTDEDGIADRDDRCPRKAGLAEFRGCPDTDGDGLPDKDDECPEEAGPAASFGCPDRDGDLVPDGRDKCPDKAANPGIDPKRSDGCPSRVFVTKDSIVITETVYFDTGKATIKPVSFSLLDDVAAVLNAYPQIKKVQIEGHTDDQGDDASNLKLSQDRAASVLAYLTGHGVDAARLLSAGFGETKPIADNTTKEGRALNRRVTFVIVEQEQIVEEVEVVE
jgi:OOP family OmpA-OmpF porin